LVNVSGFPVIFGGQFRPIPENNSPWLCFNSELDERP
jgi:hypothetical protein